MGILQRSDPEVPWDAQPRRGSGLEEFLGFPQSAEGTPLGFQSDRVEWRVFAMHDSGAFDAEDGLSHAWKTTPRLNLFAVDWFAPNLVLRSLER